MFELLSFMNMYVPISFTMCQSLYTASIAAKDEEDELKAKKIAVGGTMAIAAVGLALLLGGKKR